MEKNIRNRRKKHSYTSQRVKVTLMAALSLCVLVGLTLELAEVWEQAHAVRPVSGAADEPERGDGTLRTDFLREPSVKNSADLVRWSKMAYEEQWGYVYGTFGNSLSEATLAEKARQYPRDVGESQAFIRDHWMGRRTVDCMGLIKSYLWYDPKDNAIHYNGGGMPDIGCDRLFRQAEQKGTIDTIPEIEGLAVYAEGHIGVYIGNGWAIDAQSTTKGMTKTKVTDRKWTHWFKIPYIRYGKKR